MKHGQSPAAFRARLLLWRRTFDALGACAKPVVALLNGITLAGGLELALACDYMVACRSAKIGDAHANYGLVPGGSGSQRLPDAVGARWARWLMFTGSVLSADRANEIGLVQQVFDDETFEQDCWEMGVKMARRSQPGLALMKRLSTPRIPPRDFELEIEAAAHLIAAEDAREGLAAFQESGVPSSPGCLMTSTDASAVGLAVVVGKAAEFRAATGCCSGTACGDRDHAILRSRAASHADGAMAGNEHSHRKPRV